MITRFAPSPTGPLHLGHAFSAFTVWEMAAALGGTALLRIEDTDSTRARASHEATIYEDLTWLGLHWPTPVRRQSEHNGDYQTVLSKLAARGLIYPCSCTRADIAAAAAQTGVEGLVYPGTCRHRAVTDASATDALRLNIDAALAQINAPMRFKEQHLWHDVDPDSLRQTLGDPVLRRKDSGDPAYHLACTHDDMLQNITHVVRGMDLWALTPLHVLIQTVMGWPTPYYHHHDLITDAAGKRLAKIDRSKALGKYRAEGLSPNDIRRLVGLPAAIS